MNQELIGVLGEQMKKLPLEVQQAVVSPDLRKKLKEIGDRNKLHIDQLGVLEDETVLVMMGLEDPTNFLENLVKQVHIEKSVAEKVEQEVGEQIFMPIRESMKMFMEKQEPAVVGLGTNIQNPTSSPAPLAPASKLPPLEPRQNPTPMPSAPLLPIAPPITTAPPPPIKPTAPAAPFMTQADKMLSEKTVEVAKPPISAAPNAKIPPPMPGNYKKDPYREPVE